jgi:nitrite transporter NirC
MTIKLENGPLKVLLLSILCGAMMYLGVEGYRRAKLDTAKVLFVIFAVMIFILSKFEHSVANMAYVFIGGQLTIKTILYLIIMVVGNGIGAMLLCKMDHSIEKIDLKD